MNRNRDYLSGYIRPGFSKEQQAREIEMLTEAIGLLKKAYGLLHRVNGNENKDYAINAASIAHHYANELRAEKGKSQNKALNAVETLDVGFEDALDAELDDEPCMMISDGQ